MKVAHTIGWRLARFGVSLSAMLLLGLWAPDARAASAYTVVPLSGTAGQVPTGPFALNSLGDVVGGLTTTNFSSAPCVTSGKGFFWAPSTVNPATGTYTVLNGLTGATGDVCPLAVNDNGDVVGHSETTASGGATVQDGIVWSPQSTGGTVTQNLGDGVPPCTTTCSDFMSAQDVNDAGKIVGYGDTNAASAFASVGFSAQLGNSAITNLGSSTILNTNEAAVNTSGEVLLNPAPDGSGGSELLPPGGGPAGSDVPQGTANENSPLNDTGVVLAGGREYQTGPPGTAASLIATLAPLPPAGSVQGQSINNAGAAVGSSTSGSVSTAVIWPAGTGSTRAPIDLNTLVPPASGYQLYNAVDINANGWILAEAHPTSAPATTVLVLLETTSGGVTISSGNPVPEPATGSVPATFTISLPQSSPTAVTITYDTIDGTAQVAHNDYTAVPNGSVTIPAGVTSKTVQVQVDAGSGQSRTATKFFTVQLLSSTGPPISVTGGSAPQTITVPGLGGRLTDDTGAPVSGDQVTLTGTAGTGQTVTQRVSTGPNGTYQFYADPGTYTITPTAPAGARGNPIYTAVTCPGTIQPGTCAGISLVPSANLTADFKVVELIVDSTALTEDTSQASQGLCDVTPTAPQSTCTLSQAILISDLHHGRSIGFDIPGAGVPVINVPGSVGLPEHVTAPTLIDGTTQPGGRVEIAGGGNQSSLTGGVDVETGGDGSTIRGLVIHGFNEQIRLGGLNGHDVTVQGNALGVDAAGRDAPNPHAGGQTGIYVIGNAHDTIGGGQAGQGNIISGNDLAGIDEDSSSAFNVIQGNTIGKLSGGHIDGQLIALSGHDDTVGGAGGTGGVSGNTIYGDLQLGPDSVAQDNSIVTGALNASLRDTIGGADNLSTGRLGNTLVNSTLRLGSGNVVQGNFLDGTDVRVSGSSNTIGGGKPTLGNTIRDNVFGGIFLGVTSSSDNNVVENNSLYRNAGQGGVIVGHGTGNSIFANQMHANALGISLGGGPFLYNGANRFGTGPNNFQPYPLLFTLHKHGARVVLDGKLIAGGHAAYSVELYSERGCATDSVTPGQGEHYLGRHGGLLTDRLTGSASFTLSLSPHAGDHAVTATATGPDGSTSEFSPCLTIGHTAPSFVGAGVTVSGPAIVVQNLSPTGPASDRATAASATTAAHNKVPTATVRPFCPPITARSCSGTLRLSTVASPHQPSVTVARVAFKLIPGQLAAITFKVPKSVVKLLRHRHRLAVVASTTAHDGARHSRRTVRKLVLK